MTITSSMILFFLFASLLLSAIIVLSFSYTKEKIDAIKLKKVLLAKEDSILKQQNAQKEKKSGRILQKIEEDLFFSGFDTVSPYLFVSVVSLSGFIGAAVFYMVFDNAFALLIGAFLGGSIPFGIKNILISMRIKEFNEALSDAMSVIVRMMRNGVGFEIALKRSVEISQSKLFQELFAKYLSQKDVISDEKAFENMYKYVNSAELRIFGLAIGIGKSSGGKFSNTLEKLEHSIKRRVLLQRKVTVATREAKVGSYLIVGLLIFIFFILDSNFDGKIVEHFFHTKGGKFEMLMILVWVGFGLFINAQMTKVKQ